MLRKLCTILIAFALTCSVAFGAPFLAVDPDPDHAQYIVEFNGVEYPPASAIENRGVDGVIVFDLDGLLESGQTYSIRVMGVNPWGDESDWSAPLEFGVSGEGTVFERRTPNAPTVLRILSE